MHTISDLGTMYAISGQAKYGEFARAMLLAYAHNYPRYAHPAGWTVQRYPQHRGRGGSPASFSKTDYG